MPNTKIVSSYAVKIDKIVSNFSAWGFNAQIFNISIHIKNSNNPQGKK